MLERIFGEHGHAITLTNTTLALTLNYTAFKDITTDIDDARVYGGIHFRFDNETGLGMGQTVGGMAVDVATTDGAP